jgi:CRP-like cAMP-binding protein
MNSVRLCESIGLSVLEPLSAEEKAKLRAKIVRRHFKVGEELLVQGLKLDSVQFVSYGVIQGARQVADGRVLKSVRLGPGDFFGEVCLLTGMTASSTLTSITPGVLLGLCSEDLEPILASRPELVESVSDAVASLRRSDPTKEISIVGRNTSEGVAGGARCATESTQAYDRTSQPDSLHLAQCNFVVGSVVEFGCSRRLMPGHLLGVLKPSVVL